MGLSVQLNRAVQRPQRLGWAQEWPVSWSYCSTGGKESDRTISFKATCIRTTWTMIEGRMVKDTRDGERYQVKRHHDVEPT